MNRTEHEKIVNNIVSDMVEFAKNYFDLNDFDLVCKKSYSKHRVRSWGGIKYFKKYDCVKGYISLQLLRYYSVIPDVMYTYHEYDKISHHPSIGSFTGNSIKCTTATIAHEIAHAIDHYINLKTGNKLIVSPDFISGSQFKGHERSWQYIYHVLRNKFINS